MKPLYMMALFCFGLSCSGNPSNPDPAHLKQEIIEVEKNFVDSVARLGVARAFYHFAADSAVLLRGDKLIKGKVAMSRRFEETAEFYENSSLVWEPEFVDVSSSGDLAYTYGSYVFTLVDSIGEEKSDTGIFHTVWKRQTDGQWKFVWD